MPLNAGFRYLQNGSVFSTILVAVGLTIALLFLRPVLTPRRKNVTGSPSLTEPGEDHNKAIVLVDREGTRDNQTNTDDAGRVYPFTLRPPKTRKLKSREYTVGIITALSEELRAVMAILDERHHDPSDFNPSPQDTNAYTWG